MSCRSSSPVSSAALSLLLCRTTSDEAVPQELQSAIAVAAHLLDKALTPIAESPSSTVVTDGLGADTPSVASPVTDEKVSTAHFLFPSLLLPILGAGWHCACYSSFSRVEK